MRKVLYSLLLLVFSITNTHHSQCHYLMYMYDSYGDGWNSAYLEVNMNGTFVGNFDCSQSFTLDSVYSTTGSAMEFIWHSGNWDSEISFTIMDPMGDTLINVISASDLDDLDFFTHTSNSTCQSNNPCLSPNFLNAGNITPNSADLLWQAGGNETSWNLEWGISGFTLGSGTLVNGLTSTNYSLSSLSNNTSYDFYVQANCSNSNVSSWIGPYTFNTNNISTGTTCGTFTLELYDSYGDGWNGASLDVIINGSPFQNVTLANGNGPEIFTFSTDSNDIIDIIYNTGSWDNENTYNLTDNSGNLIVSQGLNGFISNVDPVSVFGIVACVSCPIPTNLSANTSTAGTALLDWNGGSGTFNVEWGPIGFIQGSGTLVNNISVNSYLLNGLNNSTTYDFYVQEACSANEISAWAGPLSFTTAIVAGSCGIFNLELYDSFGDGWNGGFMDVVINGNLAFSGLTLVSGNGPEIFPISVNIGDVLDFVYTPGSYSGENSYKVLDENGVLVFEEGLGNSTPNSVFGVEACPSCPAPSNLSANTSTTGTALLDWTGGSSPFGGTFNIEWGPTGFNQGNGTVVNNINGVSYLLNGLSSITTYDYYVQEVCNANDLSSWVGPLTFTTIYFSSGSECGVYSLKLINNFGQGWGNSFAKVKINNNVYQTYTLSNGTSETFNFPLDSNDILDVVINFSSSGVWGSDLQYILYDPNNVVIASEQGTGSNEPPKNTYGYQACATAPNSTDDFCDIYTLIMRKVFGGDWQGNVEIEINNNVEYVGSFIAGGYRRSEPISFGVRGNDEVRVIANGLNGFDEYYSVQNGSLDTIIDVSISNGYSPTITVQPCYFVGLENSDINQNINIYPNPTRDILFISSVSEIKNIIITNVYGQIVYENYETGVNFELDLSYLSNNLYHISFTDANNLRSSSKIMVSH
ncbi:T9SS type A sorting domain-containing protein [Flavobacteriales bacterium]|nr:T9SS type A sorting domain-containing protein [Flavobacteriales bacterium]